jgi:hypothetical protein
VYNKKIGTNYQILNKKCLSALFNLFPVPPIIFGVYAEKRCSPVLLTCWWDGQVLEERQQHITQNMERLIYLFEIICVDSIGINTT